jgi:hypothetical protein
MEMMSTKYCVICREYFQNNVKFCTLCGSNLIRIIPEGNKANVPLFAGMGKAKKKRGMAKASTILVKRYGIGKTGIIIIYAILFRPILDMIKDEGILGKYFSNTQNPPG